MEKRRCRVIMSAILAVPAMMGCASRSQIGKVNVPTGDANPHDIPDQTRDFHLELPRLGFEHALQVRHSLKDVFRDLRNGAMLRAGDRLRVTFVTSENASLYLAFCAGGKLAVYPSLSGIQTKAGELMTVPEGAGDLVVDDRPGHEVLYVILSRFPVAITDPRLTRALATARPPDQQDCSTAPEARLSAPAGQRKLRESELPSRDGTIERQVTLSRRVLRGTVVSKKPVPPNRGSSGQAPPVPLREGATGPSMPPDPDFERSPEGIVWQGADGAGSEAMTAADADGIAVVRYRFVHIASNSTP